MGDDDEDLVLGPEDLTELDDLAGFDGLDDESVDLEESGGYFASSEDEGESESEDGGVARPTAVARDPAEVEALVEAHLDYARALAFKISKRLPASVDVDELMGYGRLGLTQAAQAYDPDMGVAFTTFSYYRIRGAVFDGLREMTWLPPESRKANQRMEAEDSLCEGGLGQVPLEADPEALARGFRDAVKSLGAVFLLSDASEEDQVEAVDEESAADRAERRELVRKVRDAIATLDDQQRTIVRLVYFEHRSMSDVARDMGVNKSTVSRAHGKAVEVLRDLLSG